MHKSILAVTLLACTSLAHAQDAGADLSIPAPPRPTVENTVNTNSDSSSTADSASVSHAGAYSDQGQSQSQGQSATQGNSQSTNLTFEASVIPKETNNTVRTNNAVPLAAAVSFSSDYCGGIVSGGASGFGLSLGASAPKMDGNCQSLRRAEKFGVAAVTARNMGDNTTSARLMAMMTWELCTSEDNQSHHKGKQKPSTQNACELLGLVASGPIQPADSYTATDEAKAAASITQSQRAEQAISYAQEAVITGSDGRAVKISGR